MSQRSTIMRTINLINKCLNDKKKYPVKQKEKYSMEKQSVGFQIEIGEEFLNVFM